MELLYFRTNKYLESLDVSGSTPTIATVVLFLQVVGMPLLRVCGLVPRIPPSSLSCSSVRWATPHFDANSDYFSAGHGGYQYQYILSEFVCV